MFWLIFHENSHRFGMSIPQFTRAQSPKLWVPPEDHPHEATFMQWPVDPAVYTDRYHLKQVQRTIATIANTISAFEPVIMLADAAFHASARKLLSDQVALWNIPTNDLWCRDSGPIIAFDDTDQRVVSFRTFNSMDGAVNNPTIMTHRLRNGWKRHLISTQFHLVWWGKQAGLKPMARAH